MEEHVAGCASCLEALKKTLTPRDTLNEFLPDSSTLAGAAPGEASKKPIVEALMKRLEKLKPAGGGGAAVEMQPLACGGCGKKLKVKAALAGKKVKCPACGQVIVAQASGSGGTDDRTLPPLETPLSVFPAEEAKTLAPRIQEEAEKPKRGNQAAADTFADRQHQDDETVDELWDFLAPPQAADEIGRLGAYRILKVLGHGGMGVVFKAEDPGLQRTVALKAMLPALAASASAKKRFLREARAAAASSTTTSSASTRSAKIAASLSRHGVPEGEPLDERLKRDNVLPMAEVLRIGREIAEGLAAAHDQGLIHRDIKPANIWLERQAEGRRAKRRKIQRLHRSRCHSSFRVKILDFGLARSATIRRT